MSPIEMSNNALNNFTIRCNVMSKLNVVTGDSHVTLKQGDIVKHGNESMHKALWTVSKLCSNVALLKTGA